jgi:hypothetical protein
MFSALGYTSIRAFPFRISLVTFYHMFFNMLLSIPLHLHLDIVRCETAKVDSVNEDQVMPQYNSQLRKAPPNMHAHILSALSADSISIFKSSSRDGDCNL